MQSHPIRTTFFVLLTTLAALVFISSLIQLMLPSAEAEVLPPMAHMSYVQRSHTIEGDVTDNEITNVRAAMPVSDPVTLSIPDIQVNAKIEKVGLTAAGAMGTPSSFKTVGWYRYGPKPGEPGSAVLGGHVDNALALAGVFKRLHELQPGNVVLIQTADGKQLRFRVKKVETYAYNNVPADEIFSQNGSTARLNLVTCAGSWLRKEKTYDQRLVVFTELE